MDVLRFDRWDFLGTKALLVLVAVGTPMVAVVLPVVTWVTGGPLVWRGDLGTSGPLDQPGVGARAATEVTWPGTAEVTIAHARAGAWVASLLPGLVVSLATVTMAVLLFWLLRRIQRGEPFVASSVTVLRLIALTLVVSGILTALAAAIADSTVRSSAIDVAEAPVFVISFAGPGVCLLAGLLVAALGEAFAHGAALADDVHGLV